MYTKTLVKFLLKILLLLVLLFQAKIATAQMWTTRLFVPLDSTMLQNDSTKLLYQQAVHDYHYPTDSIEPHFNAALFMVIYQPERTHIYFKPIDNIFRKRYLEAKEKKYRLPAAIEAEEHIHQQDHAFEDVVHYYAVDHPEKVLHTWSEIPEPYREFVEGRKISRDHQRELIDFARQLHQNQQFDRSMRHLPQKPVSPWVLSGEENAQISQLWLCNWTKGGETALTISFDFRAKALYIKDKHQWENDGVHKLGLTYTGALGGRISDDEFSLTTKYGYQAKDSKWFYSFQTSFKSQLFRSFDSSDTLKVDPKSTIFSPAYLQLAFGMDYKTDDLNVLLSPYTVSFTLVADTGKINKEDYGIYSSKKSKVENGISVTSNWRKRITTEITYTSAVDFFFQYSKDGSKQFNWENIFDMQINRFLSARVLMIFRYFNNESKKFQLKENVCIAFKYVF